ncbi:hypothetical protein CHS0354_026630 [Potamilus streckersoni]|uniref:Rho GTPase-activating protein 1 n=1 Tax=Potamilus streckersoni TaxID=2493646 RepID=A0AAE0SZA8_9BIVA|nr:hypothetical protein CHS0354_026630 [Potamilus streckersoni]
MADSGAERLNLEFQDSFDASTSTGTTPTEESRSDFQDPELEFDEGGVELAPDEELSKNSSEASAPFRGGSITPDGLIDEDFEQEIGTRPDEEEDIDSEYQDISRLGIIEYVGDDVYGRKVIVFSSCKLPPKAELDHMRLLEYMKQTLDKYVENDYVIVYFHYGLTSKNKPKLSWLVQVYRELDRKYKKNLKALYLVHPTNFIKIIWNIFKPFISVKFGKKVMYVNYLHELKELLHFDQLKVPAPVLQHNAKLLSSNKPSYPYDSSKYQPQGEQLLPDQQFGVTLAFIKSKSGSIIPPVVQQTVEFLRQHELDTEGIFRRSANATILKEVQQNFNKGIPVDFAKLNDATIPAVLLKTFLRQLKEPILTFDLFEPITRLHGLEREKQVFETRRMLREELPEDNYQVLKYIIDFLVEVAAHSEKNRMTSANLAIVFGPNLIWPKGQASLSAMNHLNTFAHILIDHFDELFTR